MKYVLVNPYPWKRRNGVTSYLRNLLGFMRQIGADAVCISNDEFLPPPEYLRVVRDRLTAAFGAGDVLVEAPEVGCPTLQLPREYPVHIRLHCPSALVEMHDARDVNRAQFADELEVVRTARIVSSPSYALLEELAPYVDVSSIHVYKNPPPLGAVPVPAVAKKHDVVFLGRFSRLKGVDMLNTVLGRLPPRYSVVLAGRGADAFAVSPAVRCHVTIRGEIVGRERFRLLGETRVALTLSRFENCPMMVLESLAFGAVVAGWRVGGQAEIAGPELIRLVPFGDVDALVATIVGGGEGPYPRPRAFRAATAMVAEDFRRGWERVRASSQRDAGGQIYRGLDCTRILAGSPRPDGHDSYPASRAGGPSLRF